MSKVTALYHIVFCTKQRRMVIPKEYQRELYMFLYSEIARTKCKVLRIGGIANHVHILLNLHPEVALAKLIQTVKGGSSAWMGRDPRFGLFQGWAAGYYGCTVSPHEKDAVIEYIKSQELHHGSCELDKELIKMYKFADLEYDERDLR